MGIYAIPIEAVESGFTVWNAFSTAGGDKMIYIDEHPGFTWHRGAIAYRVRVKLKQPKFSLLKEMKRPSYRGIPIHDWMGP